MFIWKDDIGVNLDDYEEAYLKSWERWRPNEDGMNEWGPMCAWPKPSIFGTHMRCAFEPYEHRETKDVGHPGIGLRTTARSAISQVCFEGKGIPLPGAE